MLEWKLCNQFISLSSLFFSVCLSPFAFIRNFQLTTIGSYNFCFKLSNFHILLLVWTLLVIDVRYFNAHAVHCCTHIRISHQCIIGFLVCFSRVIIVCNQFFVSLIRFLRLTSVIQIERIDKFGCWKFYLLDNFAHMSHKKK